MFDSKTYLEVNREERFFCALLFHWLLASPTLLRLFVNCLADACKTSPPVCDVSTVGVYPEVAALRDYWHALGNCATEETAARREEILDALDAASSTIRKDNPKVFQTTTRSGNPTGRARFPGKWTDTGLKTLGEADNGPLHRVRRAFNAKPDLLVVCGTVAFLLEAKIESPFSEEQMGNQREVARWLRQLVPAFSGTTFHNVLLAVNLREDVPTVTWSKVLEMVDREVLPHATCFERECLGSLRTLVDDSPTLGDDGEDSTA